MTTIDDVPVVTPTSPPGPGRTPIRAVAGQVAKRGALAAARRLGRGLVTAPDVYRWWVEAACYDQAIDLAHTGGDTKTHGALTDKRVLLAAKRHKIVRWGLLLAAAVAFGGWFWATAALSVLTLLAFWALVAGHATLSGCIPAWAAWAISALLYWVDFLKLGIEPMSWSPVLLVWPAGLALVAVVWLFVAARDGSIADNLPDADLAPAEPADAGPISDGRLAKHVNDATPGLDVSDPAKAARVVEPGLVWAPGGKSWTARVDTGGVVPAAAILTPKVRTALAAKLRVGESHLQLVVDRGNAALLEITGIVGDPWGPPTRSPLVTAESVDLWEPVPFGRDLVGQPVTLDVPFNNFFFGGMPDAGKSSSMTGVLSAFLRKPKSKVWVIDGGEVDTEPYHRAGLTHRWCRDPEEAIEILREFNADITATQSALAEMGKKKVDQEFFAETGTDFDLLDWDEVEGYLNHPDAKIRNELRRLANDAVSRCRKTGKVILCATQSMDADSLDSAFRDKFMVRLAHYCRTRDMSDKILGAGAAARGLDASLLDAEVQGIGWFSTRAGTRTIRPHFFTDPDVDEVIRKAKVQRRAAGLGRALPDVLPEMARVIRSQGAAMNSTELLDRLRRDDRFADLDAVALADLVRPWEVRTVKSNGTKHYLLADVERALTQAS